MTDFAMPAPGSVAGALPWDLRKMSPPPATDEGHGEHAAGDVKRDLEGELVAAARAGDERAFEGLVEAFRARLIRHLTVTAADREEPEEVAQEALARAWSALPTFDGRSRFYTWLYGIANFVRLDRRRRRASRVEGRPDALAEAEATCASAEPDPLERLLESEREARMRALLLELPERQRLALILRVVEKLRCEEIGEQLGTTANGASLLIFRAKAQLAERLPAEWLERWRKR